MDAGTPLSAAAATYGVACPNPSSLKCGLHAALSLESYPAAIRGLLLAGGDQCSRGILAGALLGAVGGVDVVPADWVSRTAHAAAVLEQASRLLD